MKLLILLVMQLILKKDNIAYAKENNINLVSKLNKAITHSESFRTIPMHLNLTKMQACMSARLVT